MYFALFAALYGLCLWIWLTLLAMTGQGWTKNQRAIAGDGGRVDYFFGPTIVGKAGSRPDCSRLRLYSDGGRGWVPLSLLAGSVSANSRADSSLKIASGGIHQYRASILSGCRAEALRQECRWLRMAARSKM